ncbi:MAG: NAD-binding protein [Proteobacteria bacterium]|nr:NAD-binding protein [Pseudomonadota bacterium]
MSSISWGRVRLLLNSRVLLFSSIITIFITLVLLVSFFESQGANEGFRGLGDAFWWAMVTASTTGYGDIVPQTGIGRILAAGVMFLGVISMSLITGTVASVLVERKILRGLGMEKIILTGHLIICGYNFRLIRIIGAIRKMYPDNLPILVINQAEEEKIMEVMSQTKDRHLHFLRGDYVHEEILKQGNAARAQAALILSDFTFPERTDERTILAALALRAANPSLRIIAEIQQEENIPHLRRARVNEIVCGDSYTPFILASGVFSSGIPRTLNMLLQPGSAKSLKISLIPESLAGKTFQDVFQYFREKEQAMAIGLISETRKGISLSDILSTDSSAIDQFITRKLSETQPEILTQRSELQVELAPADEQKVEPKDMALLLGGKS